MSEIDRNSGRRQGLFQAVRALQDSGVLSVHEIELLNALSDWFDEHLKRPTRLAISSRHHGKRQALSWFKHTATNHIAKMREFAVLPEHHETIEVLLGPLSEPH